MTELWLQKACHVVNIGSFPAGSCGTLLIYHVTGAASAPACFSADAAVIEWCLSAWLDGWMREQMHGILSSSLLLCFLCGVPVLAPLSVSIVCVLRTIGAVLLHPWGHVANAVGPCWTPPPLLPPTCLCDPGLGTQRRVTSLVGDSLRLEQPLYRCWQGISRCYMAAMNHLL